MTDEVTITREKLIPLALLEASGRDLQGKTRLQKLAFLLDEEELGDQFDAYSFRKYDYGPFSKQLLEDIESLERKGIVDIQESRTLGGNKRYDYELTAMGENVIEELLQMGDVEEVFEAAQRVVAEYGEMSLRELIEHVYDAYPEYEENSVYQY
ncbi:hypothetical protein D3D02_17820 [Halobellus sp. Atlit-38R]|uniref:hypothetical protein n=1 Tax=Halobellus sp. Atlit-38R TaxID=2282131 RepID=UPI000EF20355|nr:hypothetical protein [Halobellus sp. Atlit-38R]RLM83530.1 hypothetical protein D3D02_17820 [Halobellus sp. Atlit-38R]